MVIATMGQVNSEKFKWFGCALKEVLGKADGEGFGIASLYEEFFNLYQTSLDPLAIELHFSSPFEMISSVKGVKMFEMPDEQVYVRFSEGAGTLVRDRSIILNDSDNFVRNGVEMVRVARRAVAEPGYPTVQFIFYREESLAGYQNLKKLLSEYADYLRDAPDEMTGRIAPGMCLLHWDGRDGLQRCFVVSTGTFEGNRFYLLRGLDNGVTYHAIGERSLSEIPSRLTAFPAFAIIACLTTESGNIPVARNRMIEVLTKLIDDGAGRCHAELVKVYKDDRLSGRGCMHEVKLHIMGSLGTKIYPDELLERMRLLR